MNRKIISISIVGFFLLTAFFGMSAVGMNLKTYDEKAVDVLPNTEVLYLRPYGPGTYQEWDNVKPASTQHWQAVDDPIEQADEGDTTISDEGSLVNPPVETFNLPDIDIDNGIRSVEVFIRVKNPAIDGGWYAEYLVCPVIYTNNKLFLGNNFRTEKDFTTYSHTWTKNPATSHKWTVEDINSLEIGIELRMLPPFSSWSQHCTQIYAKVVYEAKSRSLSEPQTRVINDNGDTVNFYLHAFQDVNNNGKKDDPNDEPGCVGTTVEVWTTMKSVFLPYIAKTVYTGDGGNIEFEVPRSLNSVWIMAYTGDFYWDEKHWNGCLGDPAINQIQLEDIDEYQNDIPLHYVKEDSVKSVNLIERLQMKLPILSRLISLL